MKQFLFKPTNFYLTQLTKPTQILGSHPIFNYKLFIKKKRNLEFEKERKEYNEKMKVYRRKHLQEFWQEQTQVENTYIENDR